MSITISFSFADAAAAAEFLGLVEELGTPLPEETPKAQVKAILAKESAEAKAELAKENAETVEYYAKQTVSKKPAKTEPPAPTPPTAVEEVKAPEPVAQEAAPQVMEYASLAARITKLIGATNPKRVENRQAIKDFFGECAESYSTDDAKVVVKSGQDVRVEDRPLLASLLTNLESTNG